MKRKEKKRKEKKEGKRRYEKRKEDMKKKRITKKKKKEKKEKPCEGNNKVACIDKGKHEVQKVWNIVPCKNFEQSVSLRDLQTSWVDWEYWELFHQLLEIQMSPKMGKIQYHVDSPN